MPKILSLYEFWCDLLTPTVLTPTAALDASDNNGLKQVPASIGSMGQLVTMDLKETSINRLPPSFGKLHHLASVALSDMNLTALPDSFCRLVTLGAGGRCAFVALRASTPLDRHDRLAS